MSQIQAVLQNTLWMEKLFSYSKWTSAKFRWVTTWVQSLYNIDRYNVKTKQKVCRGKIQITPDLPFDL